MPKSPETDLQQSPDRNSSQRHLSPKVSLAAGEYDRYAMRVVARGGQPVTVVFDPETTSVTEAIKAAKLRRKTP